MATWWRRSSRSWSSLAPVMSSPFITTWPAVGSISRVSNRISVDLPEPDRPITTNTSPGRDLERDVLDRHHAARLGLQVLAREIGVRGSDDLLGAGAEDLPQAVDGERGTARRRLLVEVLMCCPPTMALAVRVERAVVAVAVERGGRRAPAGCCRG